MICPSCGKPVDVAAINVVEESADESGIEVGYTCSACNEYLYAVLYAKDFYALVDIEE